MLTEHNRSLFWDIYTVLQGVIEVHQFQSNCGKGERIPVCPLCIHPTLLQKSVKWKSFDRDLRMGVCKLVKSRCSSFSDCICISVKLKILLTDSFLTNSSVRMSYCDPLKEI